LKSPRIRTICPVKELAKGRMPYGEGTAAI
jgi:hypothetical protein